MTRKVRVTGALISAGLFAAGLSVSSQPAGADPQAVQQLIDEMTQLSHGVEAKNEEVKQAEDEITAKQQQIDEIKARLAASKLEAQAAKDRQNSTQGEVDRLAQAKYRGAAIDPISTVIGAQNPQTAIDRSAYMTALSTKTEALVDTLSAQTKQAGQAADEVARQQAVAEYENGELVKKRDDLQAQQDELKQKIEQIKDQVDGLSPADRAVWEAKNGPVVYSLAGISGDNPSGMAALEAAMTKLGSPYSWGATGPNAFDCSGLVVWSYLQQGKRLPRTSQAQMAGGTPVSKDQLQPGDVVGFYAGATHVGIYAGNGMVVHASDYGIPVQVVPLDSMPFYGARRY